jgi:hypothetical protein
MELTVTTAKYALALMSVGGAAAGLSLGVMELTGPPTTQAAKEVLLSSGSESIAQDPIQVVVDVPVVVPDSMVGTTLPDAVPQAVAPAKASFSAPAPAAPASAQTTVKAAPKAPVETAAPRTTKAPATSAAPQTTQAPATKAAVVMAATDYKYYDFPGMASQIIVARHGDGSLEFWSATTESGWNYRVEKDTSTMVELKFSREPNGEGEAKWILQYQDGDLSVNKESSFGGDEDEQEEEDDD